MGACQLQVAPHLQVSVVDASGPRYGPAAQDVSQVIRDEAQLSQHWCVFRVPSAQSTDDERFHASADTPCRQGVCHATVFVDFDSSRLIERCSRAECVVDVFDRYGHVDEESRPVRQVDYNVRTQRRTADVFHPLVDRHDSRAGRVASDRVRQSILNVVVTQVPQTRVAPAVVEHVTDGLESVSAESARFEHIGPPFLGSVQTERSVSDRAQECTSVFFLFGCLDAMVFFVRSVHSLRILNLGWQLELLLLFELYVAYLLYVSID
ncbi:hypothetical protein JTE90_025669 [Oedothorax gibbosus]|uniref:Uncharacterized protein n=1 Tax=Oedothorax gibbosus TaxID=931172 RepID=A0AAV6THR1_9ARAC|nr:hypothetical protein JTE90_025669 [Oedothorax gibbosus]